MKACLLGLAVMLWCVLRSVLAALNFFSCKAQMSLVGEHLDFNSNVKNQSFCSSYAFLECIIYYALFYLSSFSCI